MGAVYDMLNEDKRNAIEIIVEERAEERDPGGHATAICPDLEKPTMSLFRIGLNPYGLTYTTGLQGAGTPRANPDAVGTRRISGRRARHRRPVRRDSRQLAVRDMTERGHCAGFAQGLGEPGRLDADADRQHGTGPAIRRDARRTPSDARARSARRSSDSDCRPCSRGRARKWGARWHEMVAHARATLVREAPRAADAGLVLAIEDHQDFGSEELVTMAEEAGENVGVVLDTGNPFAVGEDPVAFTRRAAASRPPRAPEGLPRAVHR